MSDQPRPLNRGNFAVDREKASRAGHIGGQRSSGNFAHDRARAAEAGRKGGERSHGGGGRHSAKQEQEKAPAPVQHAGEVDNGH